MLIADIVSSINADITDKVALDSISQADVGDNMVNSVTEHVARGLVHAATVADLGSISGVDTLKVFVPGRGIYQFVSSQPTTGEFYAASGTGFWQYREQKPDLYLLNKERDVPPIFRLSPGSIGAAIEPVTKNGALATAAVDLLGVYDRFTVTGGDSTSWMSLDKWIIGDHQSTMRMRLHCGDVGVTAPIIGIGAMGKQLADDTGSAMMQEVFVNLLTKAATVRTDQTYTTGNVVTSSAGTLASDGDVLDLELKMDPANDRLIFTILNETTGEWLTVTRTVGVVRTLGYTVRVARIILTDGAYTPLSLEVISSVRKRPLVQFMGDSYTMGDNTAASVGWGVRMSAQLPYDVLESAGNGAYVRSMARYQLPDTLRMQPRYVVVNSILAIFYGYFNSGDANQVAFDAEFTKMMNAIISYGGKPILIKWQNSGGFLNAHGTAWNAAVNGYVATWPTTKVLDFSGITFQLNVGSHPSSSDFATMTQKLTELLRSDGAII